MGGSRWDEKDWSTHAAATSTKTTREIFSSRMDKDLDPKTISVRESCDSEANPNSTPVMIGVDVTGSMGALADIIVRKGLGTIMQGIYDRKPVSDPHILLMAIGDSNFDEAPLQVTQFEADIRLAEQLTKFWLEGGGGANSGESYTLAWYFAANKTACDSQIKRGKKGYLFTIGDEPPLDTVGADEIKRVFGDGAQGGISSKVLLEAASQNWEVFHLIVDPKRDARQKWKELLGQRAIDVSDHTKLGEVIISTIQVIEGEDADAVSKSWSGDTSLVVANAVKDLARTSASETGVVRF